MGKRILQRRRGKGGIQFRVSPRGKIAPVRYPMVNSAAGDTAGRFTIKALLDEKGRSAPIAQLQLGEHGPVSYIPAVNGMVVGNEVQLGPDAVVANGNILPLKKIPEGTRISNIELRAGDGGKLVRAGGGSAILFSKGEGKAIVRLPSGKSMLINAECRATIGEIAGGGRLEKPFLRAGPRHHAMRAKGIPYPRMRGVAMAVVYHPFGGGRHQHPGKSTSTSRNAPPGRKVGLIAPKKTGRKRLARTSVEVKER
ncbi:MAG TPA: 50S ribosomal protein L2 [Nitrososphaerales archaeon]|nr:50S ribosomal protein L2 [Nitrososphaerales archaeon]